MATKTTKYYLKESEVNPISKNLMSAIQACTKVINATNTPILIDGTSAKTELKKVRTLLQKANDALNYSVTMKIK